LTGDSLSVWLFGAHNRHGRRNARESVCHGIDADAGHPCVRLFINRSFMSFIFTDITSAPRVVFYATDSASVAFFGFVFCFVFVFFVSYCIVVVSL